MSQFLDATLAKLLSDLPDAVIVLDAFGRLKWGNRAAERLFNRRLEDSIDLAAFELVHPEDLELVLRSIASVQGKETGTLIEVRVRTGKGWRLLEVIGARVTWDEEEAVLFSLRDLTERRRFELARNQEARLRSLVQNSAAVTILVSSSGLVESVSGALNRILGHDPEFVEHRSVSEIVCEDDRATLAAAFLRASRGASAANPVTVSVRLLRYASTATVPFELTLVNLLDDPTVKGFVISAHDITMRVHAEEELRDSEQRFRSVFTQGPLGIALVDLGLKITDVNGALCGFLDRKREEMLGSTLESFMHPEDLAREEELVRQMTHGKIPSYHSETRFVTEGGDLVFGKVTASMVRNDHGVPTYGLRVIEDVTKRKHLEQELVAHAATASKLLASVTSRETEILELLCAGLSAPKIAKQLSVSVRTVESHLARAYRKLGVRSRDEAVAEFNRLTRVLAELQQNVSVDVPVEDRR
jgi:PAS domain S-box-containing protein